MNNLILGVDAGNYMCKVMGPYGVDTFRSNICEWFERNVEETFSEDDMEFEIDRRKGFAGPIAHFEDEFGDGTRYGESKAHEDVKIRVLLSIFRYMEKFDINTTRTCIVTGQPIKSHIKNEKETIMEMLKGPHLVEVNGKRRSINIDEIAVAPEGSAAFWAYPQVGVVRIIDIGSGTVNAATIIDDHHINNSSTTFNFGVETVRNKDDLKNIANGIIRNTTKLKWNKNDRVLICGGSSEGIAPFIAEHYTHAELLKPVLRGEGGLVTVHPTFANAIGYFALAKGAFEINE